MSPRADASIGEWVEWIGEIELPPDSKQNIYGRRIKAAPKRAFNPKTNEDQAPAENGDDD